MNDMGEQPYGWTYRYDWGVRFPDGREVWAADYGIDGVWIPSADQYGFTDAVDIDDEEHGEVSIYRSLDAAGLEGVVIRRLWTPGPVEIIPRDTARRME